MIVCCLLLCRSRIVCVQPWSILPSFSGPAGKTSKALQNKYKCPKVTCVCVSAKKTVFRWVNFFSSINLKLRYTACSIPGRISVKSPKSADTIRRSVSAVFSKNKWVYRHCSGGSSKRRKIDYYRLIFCIFKFGSVNSETCLLCRSCGKLANQTFYFAEKTIAVSIFHCLNFEVCGTSPALCFARLACKSAVLPI